jgi:hypothetical protein
MIAKSVRNHLQVRRYLIRSFLIPNLGNMQTLSLATAMSVLCQNGLPPFLRGGYSFDIIPYYFTYCKPSNVNNFTIV